MNFQELVACAHKKGKQEELTAIISSAITKLPEPVHKDLIHKMEEIAYSFSLEEAKGIVHHMIPYGEHWSYEKVKDFISKKGIADTCSTKYYLVMNMAYNDYNKTAELFGQKDNPDFYYQIAYDFINDADAADFKVEKYFKM